MLSIHVYMVSAQCGFSPLCVAYFFADAIFWALCSVYIICYIKILLLYVLLLLVPPLVFNDLLIY